ncbi:MAG: Gfo/Idh/MocA family oxidoreductase [Ruminococcaceae bacterium]|nr:Gfo/Idh/MocA family oxidoreductase [Oscillospiraceae bacterium]
MKKIRIGHIGIAHDHAAPVLKCVLSYPELFEFIGWAEENPANYAKKIVTDPFYDTLPRKSAQELIDARPDAMLIEGYELDNLEMALLCVQNGIHIHMDKPAGADLPLFGRVLEEAKKHGVCVHMGYMYRYNHAVRYALDRIKDGTLGEIFQVDAFMDTCHDPEKREWMRDFPGGDMFYLGCHMVDFVYMMMGKAPQAVHPFNRRSHIDGTDVVDQGCAVMDYGTSVCTVRAGSTQVNGFGRRQLVICGTKGTIEIKPLEIKTAGTDMLKTKLFLCTKEMTGGEAYDNFFREIEIEPMKGRYDDMMLEFAAIVHGEIENPYSYEYEYELQRLVLEACGER